METRPIDYGRFLRMAAAAEARSFLKVTFALADISGTVYANDKDVQFHEAPPGRLRIIYRCRVYVSCSDGITERYIVIGHIDRGGLDCHSIITDDGGKGVLIYWDNGREHEDRLQTVRRRRRERKQARDENIN